MAPKTRGAEDFDGHLFHDLRRYLATFSMPQPASYSENEVFILPDARKSHENSALSVRLEAWRVLENIRPLSVSDTDIREWLNMNATTVSAAQIICEGIERDIQTQSSNATNGANGSQSTNITSTQNTNPIQNTNPPSQSTSAAQGENGARKNPKKGPYSGDKLPQRALSNKFYAQKPCDIEIMVDWLSRPLVTAFRVMHQIDGRRNVVWHARAGPRNIHDASLFRHYRCPNMIVAYQTPYVLGGRELQEFVQCRSFPQICNPQKKPSLKSQHKLWAKIWDICVDANIPWFILTTYTQWVVGCFSPGWRIGFVSPIFYAFPEKPNSKNLNILEWLTYWFASAAEMPDTQKRPKVFEPILYPDDIPMDICVANTAHPPTAGVRSESNWNGADVSIAPGSAAVDELDICTGTGSLNTLGEPTVSRKPMGMIRPAIKSWRVAAMPPNRPIIDDDLFEPANKSSTVGAMPTNRPITDDNLFDIEFEWPDEILFEPGKVHGEWMIRF